MRSWKSCRRAATSNEREIGKQAIHGAIRQRNWKLVLWAPLPGRTELFDLSTDPGEAHNVADEHPDIVRDLQAKLDKYAHEMKPSEWMKAQPIFLGAQGKTILDPDFDIDDGSLPHEKPVIPKN
jgi:arylsulfatase A-like enzyme